MPPAAAAFFAATPIGAWPWERPPAPVARRTHRPSALAVLQGRLRGVGGVVLKLMPLPPDAPDAVASAERELIGATVATRLAAVLGLPTVAPLLHTARCASVAAGFGPRSGLPVQVFVYARVPDASPLCDVALLPPAARPRLVLLGLLAQLAATYAVFAQAGLAHVDNHLHNLLVQPTDADGYWLLDVDGSPGAVLRVPVFGFRVWLIDWDGACKALSPQSDGPAVLGLEPRFTTTDTPVAHTPGAAVGQHRWNPGEDWVRLGLLLCDGARFDRRALRRLLSPAELRSLFGTPVVFGAPLATGRRGERYSFLCTGEDVWHCAPVAVPPGCPAPLDALRALLNFDDVSAELRRLAAHQPPTCTARAPAAAVVGEPFVGPATTPNVARS